MGSAGTAGAAAVSGEADATGATDLTAGAAGASESKNANGCARGDAAIARQTAWIPEFQAKMLFE